VKARLPLKILSLFLLLFFISITAPHAEGRVELGFHYGRWNFNPIKGFLENTVENSLQKYILEGVHDEYPELEEEGYSQSIGYDSSGQNFGFEIRLYPGGKNTGFSIGLSVEKTTMNVSLTQVATRIELPDGTVYEGSFRGDFLFKPLSLHLSLRWDLFPSWKFHPYFTLGVGVAKGVDFEEATVDYDFTSKLTIDGELFEHYEAEGKETIETLNEELKKVNKEQNLPSIFPIVQFNLGAKMDLTENLALFADFGIWNGLLFRGGVAFLF
jgi:hypothetical protein